MTVLSGTQVITPKQLYTTWVHCQHKFQLNKWNFEVSVGDEAVSVFQESFNLKRFNTKGAKPWQPRSSKNNRTHPLMAETYSLRNSISWRASKGMKKSSVVVFTDPKKFMNTMSHKGFCFAGVHNSDDPSVRTGRVANMPQRQFMPTKSQDSSVLNDKLKKLSSMLFKGFPISV